MQSAIQEYIEQRNLPKAERYNLLHQQIENKNYIVIDKRQINNEVQNVVDNVINEINKAFK